MNEELHHQKGKMFILTTPAVQIIQYSIHSVGFYAVEFKALHPIICRIAHKHISININQAFRTQIAVALTNLGIEQEIKYSTGFLWRIIFSIIDIKIVCVISF